MKCMEGSKENWHWDFWSVGVNVNFRALEKSIWVLEKSRKFMSEKGYELACEPAHIWGTRAIASGKERKSKAIRRSEVWWGGGKKWACPDLCNFFISASPGRSEIPLIEKREWGENCQSNIWGAIRSSLKFTAGSTWSKKISWMRIFLTC